MTLGTLLKGRVSRLVIMGAACIALSGLPAYAESQRYQPNYPSHTTNWGGQYQDQGRGCAARSVRDGRWGSTRRQGRSCNQGGQNRYGNGRGYGYGYGNGNGYGQSDQSQQFDPGTVQRRGPEDRNSPH